MTTPVLDDLDMQLIDILSQDARLSNRKIANELGVTRNSVLGQVHRMGIKRGRMNPKDTLIAAPKVRPAPTQERRHALPVKPVFQPKPDVKPTVQGWPKPIGPHAVTIFKLTSKTCRMPLWGDDERDIDRKFYCGAPVERDVTYCPACQKAVVGEGSMHDRIVDRDIKHGRFS
jgi:hypothetical protein